MVLAMQLDEAEAVAEASLAAFHAHQLDAHVDAGYPVPAVVCSETKSAELALGTNHDVRTLSDTILGFAEDGWELTVLVPSRHLGVSHSVLRGTSVLLQPWWTEGGLVHFGRPEIP